MSVDLYFYRVSSNILDLLEQHPGLVDIFRNYSCLLEHSQPFSLKAIQEMQEDASYILEYYPNLSYHFITSEIFEGVQGILPQLIDEGRSQPLHVGDAKWIRFGEPPTMHWFLSGSTNTDRCDFLAKYDEATDLHYVNTVLGKEIGNFSGYVYVRCFSADQVQTIHDALAKLRLSNLNTRWETMCQMLRRFPTMRLPN